MTPKANLVLVLALGAFVAGAQGQSTTNPTLPSVPRADGSGPSTPSMSPAVGDASTPASTAAAASNDAKSAKDKAPSSADLEAAAKAANHSGAKPLPEQPERLPLAVSARTPTPPLHRKVEPALTHSVTGPVNPVSTGLNSTDLARQIRNLPFASRETFLNDLQTRVENTERDFEEVERSSFGLRGDARSTFRKALKDVKETRKALWSTLKDARSASPQAWVEVRNRLAAAYEGYAITLTRAEASSSIGH